MSSRRPVRITRAKIKRAVEAVVAAGVEVARVEVDKDERIVIIAGKPEEHTGFDANDLDAWINKHADAPKGD
jgi:hypothetical protein